MIKKIKRKIYLLLIPFLKISKYFGWQYYLRTAKEIKIVVGAGKTKYKGWFNTDIDTLDVTNEDDFIKYFYKKKIKNILAEHVLEHLNYDELNLMTMNFFKYSDRDINIRIAVPDGFHSEVSYIDKVKPGGSGEGAHDHKHLFNYKSLSKLFEKNGFRSELFIYSDAAKTEKNKKLVAEVRDYIKTIDGFRKVIIKEGKENKGLALSITSGVSEILNKYDNAIILEDDLELSPFFLKYMNEALSLYEKEEDVISIHGYVYPVKKKLPETFFLRGEACWGWETGKRGGNFYEDKASNFLFKVAYPQQSAPL